MFPDVYTDPIMTLIKSYYQINAFTWLYAPKEKVHALFIFWSFSFVKVKQNNISVTIVQNRCLINESN